MRLIQISLQYITEFFKCFLPLLADIAWNGFGCGNIQFDVCVFFFLFLRLVSFLSSVLKYGTILNMERLLRKCWFLNTFVCWSIISSFIAYIVVALLNINLCWKILVITLHMEKNSNQQKKFLGCMVADSFL